MTKKPNRVRVLIMPYQDDGDKDPVGYSGPATVLTGLPRTIRRHELPLIPQMLRVLAALEYQHRARDPPSLDTTSTDDTC
jgi:hypothetical protein